MNTADPNDVPGTKVLKTPKAKAEHAKVEGVAVATDAGARNETERQNASTLYLIKINKNKDMVDPITISPNFITRAIKQGDFAIANDAMIDVLENATCFRLNEETFQKEEYQRVGYSNHGKVPESLRARILDPKHPMPAIDVARIMGVVREEALEN